MSDVTQPTAAQRNPLAKAALHDGAGGRVDGFDASYRAPRDGRGRNRADDEYQHNTQAQCCLDLFDELINVVDILSHQQMAAVRERFECRSQQRPVDRDRIPLPCTEIAPSAEAFQARWPSSEIARERGERGVGEQIDATFEALIRGALSDCGNQSGASRIGVDLLQVCLAVFPFVALMIGRCVSKIDSGKNDQNRQHGQHLDK